MARVYSQNISCDYYNIFCLHDSYLKLSLTHLANARHFNVLLPDFRVKGPRYLKVHSRPPTFIWKGFGLLPFVEKYILHSAVSEM